MKPTLAFTTVLLLAAAVSAAEIPFPNALDGAAVVQERLDNIMENSLVLGNGDLNGLLLERDGTLVLRLTKNDVWDARVDTSKDAPIPTLDFLRQLARRDDWPPKGYARLSRPGAQAVGLYASLVQDTLPPEQQAWERVLQENLGGFYLPLHKRDKIDGRSNAWDFVQDDPKLPRVLLIGDSVSRGYTQAVRKALAEMLTPAGYATGFVGKWGMGLMEDGGAPFRQGFDFAFGFYNQGRAHSYYPDFLEENDREMELPDNKGFDMAALYAHTSTDRNRYDAQGDFLAPGVADPAKAKNSQTLIHKAGLDFIRRNGEHPFFLYYATQLPHGPVVIPNLGEYKDKDWPLKNKEWAAMVASREIDELRNQVREMRQEMEALRAEVRRLVEREAKSRN